MYSLFVSKSVKANIKLVANFVCVSGGVVISKLPNREELISSQPDTEVLEIAKV
ncbi:hypothetical protein [Natranaerofaba carboxydovora]|uniref:hypothetical protein n=1 Tax=Natranaerofaba carboxydovora TaxID=2742683 RepID=UPI001F143899|nr:hypothetical protein [Natranaerofaba carboxydovora]